MIIYEEYLKGSTKKASRISGFKITGYNSIHKSQLYARNEQLESKKKTPFTIVLKP